eukprot:scaffold188459_cov13-Tisochrysis_lutea.AAC.1
MALHCLVDALLPDDKCLDALLPDDKCSQVTSCAGCTTVVPQSCIHKQRALLFCLMLTGSWHKKRKKKHPGRWNTHLTSIKKRRHMGSKSYQPTGS